MTRSSKLLIGLVAIALLLWLRFAGSVPLLPVMVSTAFPSELPQSLAMGLADNPDALHAAQVSQSNFVGFASDILSDLLVLIGSGVIAAIAGIWNAACQFLEWMFSRSETAGMSDRDLKNYVIGNANKVLAVVSQEIDSLKGRLNAIESSGVIPAPAPPKTTEQLLEEALREIARMRASKTASPTIATSSPRRPKP